MGFTLYESRSRQDKNDIIAAHNIYYKVSKNLQNMIRQSMNEILSSTDKNKDTFLQNY